jgi:hypothetical protein
MTKIIRFIKITLGIDVPCRYKKGCRHYHNCIENKSENYCGIWKRFYCGEWKYDENNKLDHIIEICIKSAVVIVIVIIGLTITYQEVHKTYKSPITNMLTEYQSK